MHLFVVLLVIGLFGHDLYLTDGWSSSTADAPAAVSDIQPAMGGWALLGLVVLPRLALGLIYTVACRLTLRRLGAVPSLRPLYRFDRLSTAYRWLLLALYGMDLSLGSLVALRQSIGNLILIDEILFLLPSLAMLVWSWWLYYAIDRRMREAVLMRQLDSGRPVAPICSRWQFILFQARHQVALILAPMLVLMGWLETLHWLTQRQYVSAQWHELLLLGGAGCVFLFAPVMIRHLWDTAPLPAGELRNRLVLMCKQHRVGVRELLLWRTFGSMINAAVMGVIAPLRYILLTDALLEAMPHEQVEAVMAHEVAHVRKHHMIWLVVMAGSIVTGLQGALVVVKMGVDAQVLSDSQVMTWVWPIGALWLGIVLFGWVSRRFERQADTFAVGHLAQQRAADNRADQANPTEQAQTAHAPVVIDAQSVQTMGQALQQVAELNHINPKRRSWRHGSISWRQAYLQTLKGMRVDQLRIDRQVFWIKLGGVLLIGVLVLLYYLKPNWLL